MLEQILELLTQVGLGTPENQIIASAHINHLDLI